MLKNLTLHTINVKNGKWEKVDWSTDESILVNDTTAQVVLGDVDNPERKWQKNNVYSNFQSQYKFFIVLDGFAYFGMLDYFINQNNHLTAYGGFLRYNLVYTTQLFGNSLIGPDVILEANGVQIKHLNYRQPAADQRFEGSVEMIESNFQTLTGAPVSREQFMTILKDLTKIYIRAAYFDKGMFTYLSDVTLTCADEDNENYHLYQEIPAEKCMCPPGYTGLSCENCAPGYYRDTNGPFGGYCIPCECNGHASTCDCNTGICDDCQHHTTGDHCDMCVEGYFGNATLGSPYDCMICACPLPIDSNNFAYGCEFSPDGYSISCDCKQGYTGHKCQSCANGYYGRPEIEGEICKLCECSGNIDPSQPGACDTVTGECIHCLNNTYGTACNLCAPGFYGDAVLLKDCKSCICDDVGTDHCDSTTGTCVCHQNVDGEKCDRCLDDHYGFESGYGCLACECGVASNSTQCDDHTGECACKVGVTGRQCDRCLPGYWNYGPDGCTPCSCNTELSRGLGCNPQTGQCECLRSVIGEKCDSCPNRWVFIENFGCEECDGCHHALLDVTDDLKAQLKPVVSELSTVTKSYYTTQKLKKLNEETEELKPEVEKLDPNVNNLSEQMNEIDTLEMDTKNHFKKSNYITEKAAGLKKASGDLQKKTDEEKDTYKDVTNDVKNTIKEVGALANNFDSDEKATKLEKAIENAEEYFDLIKAFDPEILFKNAQKTECNVESVFADVRKFSEPINTQKENLDSFKKSLDDFNNKIDDLREKSKESQMNSLFAENMNKKNKESRLIPKLDTISSLMKEADDSLKNGKDLKNQGEKLLTELDLSLGDVDRLNKELSNLNKEIDIKLPKNEDEYNKNSPLVQSALDHILLLTHKKDELFNQYSNITANSNDAIKAVNAYAEIQNFVEVAKNKSQIAFDDATKALGLLDNMSDNAGKSYQDSNDLVHEGRDALSNVQSDLSPALQKSKDNLANIKKKIEAYTNTLKAMNDTVDGVNSDPLTESWNQIIKNADEALNLKKSSNDTLVPVLENIQETQDKTSKIGKDIEDTNKDIVQATNQVQRVGELVPNIIGLIEDLEIKQQKLDTLSSQLNNDIERLRRQIGQARSIANSIQLGVKFMPNTTLELKTPDNLQTQTFNTKISTFFKTEKPNGLLFYLGNEQKPTSKSKRADFMAIEIENGYPVLLVDVGDGPERIISSKLVDDNKWYEAIVERKGKDVTFIIREEDNQGNEQLHEKKEALTGEQMNFRLDENSRLFVGGYSDYQMPDSIKQSSFEGEIENLKIGDTDVGLWNFIDGDNNNIGSVERDRLLTKEAKNTGYRFGGNGYVVLDAKPFNFKQRSHVSFNFKAARDSPNGLLFFVGNQDHYISLELREGNVIFRFKLGQASEIVQIKSNNVFNDDEWHTVSATRDSGKGALKVDNHLLFQDTVYNPESYVAPEKMYFGGYPDKMFISGIETRNFDGCIDEVQIEGTPVDLTRNLESHDVLTGCPQKFSSVVGFEHDKSGYLNVKNLVVNNKLNINLKFKTIQSKGIIFYGMNNDQSGTISLTLDEGVLVLRSSANELNTESMRFDDGLWHVVTAIHDDKKLKLSIDDIHEFETSEPPPILMISTGQLFFGGLQIGFKPIGGAVPNEAYFVGCIQDVTINNNVVNFASSTDKVNAVLNTCPRDILNYEKDSVPFYYPDGTSEKLEPVTDMIDVRFNSDVLAPIDKTTPSTTLEPTSLTTQKQTTESTTPLATTKIESTTTIATTTLKPKPTYTLDQKNPECYLPAIPDYDVDFEAAGYRFGAKQFSYIEYASQPDITKSSFDFSLKFRTERQNGLLFYASDERQTDFIALYLKDGYVNYVFNCRGARISIASDRQYDNNEWHTINFKKERGVVSLRDENGDEKKQDLKCKPYDFKRNYFVGGGPNDKDLEDIEINLKFDKGHFTNNAYFGCIKDVTLNGQPLELSELPTEAVLPCSDLIESGVFFGKSGGFIKLRDKFKVGSDLTISMDIKPRNLTGVLTSVHGKKSFFIVEMIKGNVHFSVDSGDGPRNVIFQPDPDKSLCDGNWHTVTVIKSRFILSINVGKFELEKQ